MDHRLIEGLMEVVVPAVKEYVGGAIPKAIEPLQAQISELNERAPVPGEKGTSGEKGEQGEKGEAGEKGEQGPAGEKGDAGESGQPGDPGSPGEKGEKGLDGSAGRDGIDGKDGAAGLDGKDGAPGERGEKGLDGSAGRDGIDGKDGAAGIDGKDGAPGERGEKGLDGSAGRDGIDGKDGAVGLDGKDGAPGERGEKGLDGAAGRDGIDGKDGAAGRDGRDASDLDLLQMFIRDEAKSLIAAALKTLSLTSPDDGRTLVFAFTIADAEVRQDVKTAIPLDRGVWREGHRDKGDGVTFGGSWHIAQVDTNSKPETSSDWRLAVKRGRDGKDLRLESPREPAGVKFK